MFVALGVDVPSKILDLARTPYLDMNDTDPVSTVPHYKEMGSKETKLDDHGVVNIEDKIAYSVVGKRCSTSTGTMANTNKNLCRG